jgi:PAS domain S-box-containing protein
LFLWAAFRFGFVGVASAIFLAAASGIGTLVYVVPHIRHLPDLREEIAFLQLFLFTNVLIFLPIANLIKALQKSEGRYRSIMETTQDGFWIADLQGHLLQVNEGYCRMSGYRAQELLSMNISELETIESHSEVAEHIRTIMTKGSDRFETWHRRKDGTTYEVEISAQCCPEIENAVITFARDITRRKQAETSLRDSNEKFAKIYQLSPDAIDLTNLETGLHLETNPAHQKMFGYTREETIGHTAFPEDLNMWVNKEDREQFISRLEESGEVFGLEASMRRRGGDVFNALLSSSIVDINGERCLLTVCRDISQPKAAEIALRISEEKHSKVFRSAPILVALSHIDNGLLIDINDLYCQTFEYLREELIGKTTIELGLIKPEERQRITNLVDSKGNVKNIELSMYTKTQKTIPCLFSGETIEINGVKFLVSMLVDLTSLKQIEEHERNLEAQLYHNQKMESLGILSAGVAHNLNNVLGIIMGTASLHEKVAAEPSDREAYQTISKACARGRGVVKSMLHFAQPSLQVKAPVELHKVIQEVCVLLESTTKNAITISEGLVDEPLWIHGDSGTINHALLNICLNSIGAMPDGGTLEFRTAILEENLVEVSVRDNGTGMPPEVLAHVMEPFFTTKETGKGTGLGLSMTYGMVKAHGGTIAIVSQPGQGTTVTLRFPRIPAPVEGETVKAAPPVLAAMKVFLVDDDEDVRFLMTRMLKKAGVRQVKVFPGGKDALESLPSGELPDLIILDQNMPGLTGVQTMELIRNVHMDLPILISSGQPDIEAWDCFKQPKVGVISKPFTLDEIQAKLAQFVLESSKDLRNDPLAR